MCMCSGTQTHASHRCCFLPGQIAGFERLVRLQLLNLNGNQIRAIPPSIRALASLRVLKLARNKISSTDDVLFLKPLQHLRALSLHGNPVTSTADFKDFVVWNLRALDKLDGVGVKHSDRGVAGRSMRLREENQLPSHPLRPEIQARDELLHLVRRPSLAWVTARMVGAVYVSNTCWAIGAPRGTVSEGKSRGGRIMAAAHAGSAASEGPAARGARSPAGQGHPRTWPCGASLLAGVLTLPVWHR